MKFFARAARKVSITAVLLVAGAAAFAAGEFPFDKELLLDAPPMGRVKHVPMLLVEPNGAASIQLWCKEMKGRVEIAGDAIRIEADPLPETLPSMMVSGQCSSRRMQADADFLSELKQMTTWQIVDRRLILMGATTRRFLASDH